MFNRTSLFAVAAAVLVGSASVPSYANELGFAGQTFTTASVKSRMEVANEAAQYANNPISADGWRQVGGELGFEHLVVKSNAAFKAAPVSEQEARALRELYIGG